MKVLVASEPFYKAIAGRPPIGRAVDMLNAAGFEIVRSSTPDTPEIRAVVAGLERWDEESFRRFPNLKIIARYGVGYDAIDLAEATKRNILVTNTRVTELSKSVAEGALLLTLAALRHLPDLAGDMRKGVWRVRTGVSLIGKTVGVLGFGAIGQSFARLLAGFKARILVCDPFVGQSTADKFCAIMVDRNTLLAESDVVSVHAPNTPENHHLVDEATLGMMKRGAILVNTSRGALVNEKALYNALLSGRLGGAGLDVWEAEPTPADNPLLTLDNVVCLPHVAGDTRESVAAMAECCAGQIIDALAGGIPQYALNL